MSTPGNYNPAALSGLLRDPQLIQFGECAQQRIFGRQLGRPDVKGDRRWKMGQLHLARRTCFQRPGRSQDGLLLRLTPRDSAERDPNGGVAAPRGCSRRRSAAADRGRPTVAAAPETLMAIQNLKGSKRKGPGPGHSGQGSGKRWKTRSA